jgi:hypothetical protein
MPVVFCADVEGGEHMMQGTKYDLVANIVRDGAIDNGKYRVHILNKGTGDWFEMEDLIQSEVLPQVITLSESYLQVCACPAKPSGLVDYHAHANASLPSPTSADLRASAVVQAPEPNGQLAVTPGMHCGLPKFGYMTLLGSVVSLTAENLPISLKRPYTFAILWHTIVA